MRWWHSRSPRGKICITCSSNFNDIWFVCIGVWEFRFQTFVLIFSSFSKLALCKYIGAYQMSDYSRLLYLFSAFFLSVVTHTPVYSIVYRALKGAPNGQLFNSIVKRKIHGLQIKKNLCKKSKHSGDIKENKWSWPWFAIHSFRTVPLRCVQL